MPFSWDKAKKQTVDHKIARAISMARAGSNHDFKIAHPDWVREAQKKNYIALKISIKDLVEKQQKASMLRRDKLAGRQ